MKSGEKKYKAIIFDLDGTLINSLPYHSLAFKDLLLERGIRIDDAHLRRIIGLSTENVLKELKKKYKFSENIKDLIEERRYHYFKFIGKKNILFPGVKNLLRSLRLDYKIAIATGSSEVVFAHSTDKEFQVLFDFVSTINDVKMGKPHPAQLILVAKKLKVKPSECLYVGDSTYDHIAAKRAGMDSLGVLSGFTSAKDLKKAGAKTVLKNVNEIREVL